jgi:hypothetical protein
MARKWLAWALFVNLLTVLPEVLREFAANEIAMWLISIPVWGLPAFLLGWGYGRYRGLGMPAGVATTATPVPIAVPEESSVDSRRMVPASASPSEPTAVTALSEPQTGDAEENNGADFIEPIAAPRPNTPKQTMNDDTFYEQIAVEIQSESMLPGVWTRAFAEANGAHDLARALYIRIRVAQLSDARNAELERQRLIAAEEVRKKAVQLEQQQLAAAEEARQKAAELEKQRLAAAEETRKKAVQWEQQRLEGVELERIAAKKHLQKAAAAKRKQAALDNKPLGLFILIVLCLVATIVFGIPGVKLLLEGKGEGFVLLIAPVLQYAITFSYYKKPLWWE